MYMKVSKINIPVRVISGSRSGFRIGDDKVIGIINNIIRRSTAPKACYFSFNN
jgi:hypothetical protein